MATIFCFKYLLNFFNVDANTTKEINYSNLNCWTAHLFRADIKNCVIFLHHKTLFYFVIFDVKKEDYNKLNDLFLEGLLTELKKCFSINSMQEDSLRNDFKGIILHPKSDYNIANTCINRLITILKEIQLFENDKKEVSVEEYYKKNNIYNENFILKELDHLFTK